MWRLCQHGWQCEHTEWEGPGCSTDLVMSPNIIRQQHTQRREGEPLMGSAGQRHVRWQARSDAGPSKCRSISRTELDQCGQKTHAHASKQKNICWKLFKKRFKIQIIIQTWTSQSQPLILFLSCHHDKHYSASLCRTADKLQRVLFFFWQRRKEWFFTKCVREGERERQTGPLVAGGSISGRISKCKQTAAHS